METVSNLLSSKVLFLPDTDSYTVVKSLDKVTLTLTLTRTLTQTTTLTLTPPPLHPHPNPSTDPLRFDQNP